jgi:DNA-binding NarL/FixJ family response regulator
LLDRAMPTGAGERYIAGMRARAPSVRVLFLSGQSIEPEVARLADGVVQKPVTSVELLDAIELALSHRDF